MNFIGLTPDGNEHDVRDISNCSPEFLAALLNEPFRTLCPEPNCVGGRLVEIDYDEIVVVDLETMTAVSSSIAFPVGTRDGGPCGACTGRGWTYGMCPS